MPTAAAGGPLSHPRSPLKRSATTPLFSNNAAAATASSSTTALDGDPSVMTDSQSHENHDAPALPPAGLKAMQSALCRLSSQHHLSDYNRMKRLTTTSQPMAASSSHPLPYRQSAWASSASPSQSPSTVALPLRTSGGLFNSLSPNQAVDAYTMAALPPGVSAGSYAHEGTILEEHSKSQLSPPSAPSLYRSYTEEEGQNPHLHLGTSRGSISSVALSTPALSMDSMPPSPPIPPAHRNRFNSSSGGHSNSSTLATPPDEGGSPRSITDARLSPTARKTHFDERNDHELSERLWDAMENSAVHPSGIPVPASRTGPGGADTARLRQIQQQRSSTQQQQASHQSNSKYTNPPGLPARFDNTASSSISRSASAQPKVSSIRSSSIPMSGSRSSSTSSSTKPSSHSMMMQSSASTSMSRASTSHTSAQAGGMSSSGLGMQASLSALAHASRNDVDIVDECDDEMLNQTLYHIHVNHPDLAGVKTSLTHPMNVSPLIPPELLPLYGQSILHAVPVPSEQGQQAYQQRARSPLGKLAMHDLPPGSNLNNTNARPPSPTKSASGSSAMNISRPGTPVTAGLDGKAHNDEEFKKPFVIQPSADIHSLTGPNASAALFSLTLPISQHLAMTSANNSSCDGEGMFESGYNAPIKLGNLVLSSCPGKKVRLSDRHLTILGIPEICRPGTGPTADSPLVDPRTLPKAAVVQLGLNRSPICRDLEMDFRRAMSQADVKCVVCCIDDEELRFLGAAWEEYERVAGKLGLEIIRLPMAEGFAPPSPEVLDSHLSSLITRYTLQGKNCLVHCRGGVGRAGLFACSWMIKLGLLGQVINIHDPNNNTLDRELKIVEKVIAVIRKRRSAKAIETPQQVQFILQYTHWLASTGRHVTARQVLQEAGLVNKQE